ncbi:MAG TPA: FKBP-type peptidyl-prolyl cis-trans isomerase [Candidatus Fournierella merdavium]|uniref:FKBP-type peptidyl-prolyl cis-trans isomerase n=1 Tax=Candidatus Allofournierella merdavium TaxID=2838593 RepID=UPI001F8AC995|nr:FKBP-type peptidyl-prolyl cis-trans isomerase [Candidatus Fournierella merdavium]
MKNKMIRLGAAALALAMIAALAGCGSTSGTSGSASTSGSSASASEDVPETVEIDFSKYIDENGFWKDIRALDYVTLPQYKGVEIPAEEIEPTEEELQSNRESLLSQWASYNQITDRAVEDGDTVNIDYVGSVDGVEFTGGNTNGAGTTVTIGVTRYIDDFLEQLIGHKPGETFDVNVTFPEDYSDSTDADGNTVVLAGKDAVFTTTINYIQGDELIYPEMDDAFVAENLQATYGWTTAAEAEEGIATAIRNSKKYNYMLDYLAENAQITEVPEAIANNMREAQLASVNNQAASYGVSVDTLMMLSGYGSEDEYLAMLEEQLPEAAKFSLIRQAIAEQEGMTVTEEELQEMLGDNYQTYVDTYGLNYIKQDVMIGKVDQLLLDEN